MAGNVEAERAVPEIEGQRPDKVGPEAAAFQRRQERDGRDTARPDLKANAFGAPR